MKEATIWSRGIYPLLAAETQPTQLEGRECDVVNIEVNKDIKSIAFSSANALLNHAIKFYECPYLCVLAT